MHSISFVGIDDRLMPAIERATKEYDQWLKHNPDVVVLHVNTNTPVMSHGQGYTMGAYIILVTYSLTPKIGA